jgi:hypothetical protein
MLFTSLCTITFVIPILLYKGLMKCDECLSPKPPVVAIAINEPPPVQTVATTNTQIPEVVVKIIPDK